MSAIVAAKEDSTASVIPFRSKDKEKLSAAKLGIQTLLSHDAVFVGDIESASGMKIDGSVIGDVVVTSDTNAWIVVSKTASIEGNVSARVVAICGRVKGTVRARHVTLMPGARVDGDIYYEVLRIAEGAGVNGRLNQAEPGSVQLQMQISPPMNISAAAVINELRQWLTKKAAEPEVDQVALVAVLDEISKKVPSE